MIDLGTQTLLSIALLLALNNAVVRVGWMRHRPVLFYAVQGLDVFVAAWLFWRGIPGFEHIPAISWMLGLLLILHVVQNVRWIRSVRAELGKDEDKERRASAIRAALDE
jgi:hypothetical protein